MGTFNERTDNPLRIFSILLGLFLPEEERSIQSGDGDGDEFDRQQQSAHDCIERRWGQDEMQAEEFWEPVTVGFPRVGRGSRGTA